MPLMMTAKSAAITALLSSSMACATSPDALGRLDWGLHSAESLHTSTAARVLQLAREAVADGTQVHGVERLDLEHVLATDPRYQASIASVKQLRTLFYWAFCARTSDDHTLAASCLERLRAGLVNPEGWATKYRSEGNPINDLQLLTTFTAIDLVRAQLTDPDRTVIEGWLRQFVAAGDAHWRAKGPHDTSRINNHNTWRLAIRATVATMLADQAMIAETKRLIHQQVSDDLLAPPGWSPHSNCPQPNNLRVPNSCDPAPSPACTTNPVAPAYGGYDFRQRDALHYHVYNLEAFVHIAWFTPEMLEDSDRAAIKAALDFLRPYVLGETKHIEFCCTTVAFDIERRCAGAANFQNAPWSPKGARKVLLIGSALFPGNTAWTRGLHSEGIDPVTKFVVALRMPGGA